jgi:hypothetical protein
LKDRGSKYEDSVGDALRPGKGTGTVSRWTKLTQIKHPILAGLDPGHSRFPGTERGLKQITPDHIVNSSRE